jgi:penicillin-insensitive murein endopeptidase
MRGSQGFGPGLGAGLLAAALAALIAADAHAASRKGRPAAPPPAGPSPWSLVTTPSDGPPQAIGGFAAGCLAGGAALAPEGPGYQAIRLSRHRNYGHPALVAFVGDFGRRVEAARLGTAVIADMNQPRGGPMSFAHASHQTGLDADIWLRLDLPAMSREARESLEEIKFVDYSERDVRTDVWTRGQAELVRLAATDPRVSRIFISPAIKRALCAADWADRDWLRKVRPWYGHDGHMHVRLGCPADSPQCRDQKELPPGDGCDKDLHDWLAIVAPVRETTASDEARAPHPTLPPACRAVLSGPGARLAALH